MTKDIKYIIKRVIIVVLISIILMLIGSFKVNAEVLTSSYFSTGSVILDNQNNSIRTTSNAFANKSGNLLFTFYQASTSSGSEFVSSVSVGDGVNTFECNIGNVSFYNDNANQRSVITAVCPVSFNSNGWRYIFLYRPGFVNLYLTFSTFATLNTGNDNFSSDITSQLVSIFNRVDSGFSDMYNMQLPKLIEINNHLIDIYNSIIQNNTSITQSIDNNTQAINDINNTLKDETAPSNEDLDSILNNKSNNNNVANLIMFVPNIFASFGSGLSSNCSGSIQLGNLMGTELVLTCIRPQNYLGSTLWTIIDFMFLFGLFLAFRKWVVNIYNDLTSLKEVQFN